MRARDVEIGHTYVVLVPHRLPAARYPDRERLGTSMWVASLLTGARFRLTVSNVDYDTDPVTVEGLRLIERSHTEVTLTDDQAAALGLAPKQGYRMVGSLVDRTGRVACLPSIEPIRVPVRWLRSADDPRLAQTTHRDADLWPFM
ncbi:MULTISPECIES: hypothetical protein [Nocardia]|jgi:hypothetical protein|uniref:Uncharacterized protein n=2 Tax=Nocardia TaxID=1817 RepID=A0A2T2YWN2_9NOCA|nr:MULTISPECIES: hypothetical protein [Nocardia]PSR59910.1 hypothetical protein C8259_25110 [Nocardia nova]